MKEQFTLIFQCAVLFLLGMALAFELIGYLSGCL